MAVRVLDCEGAGSISNVVAGRITQRLLVTAIILASNSVADCHRTSDRRRAAHVKSCTVQCRQHCTVHNLCCQQ